MRTETIFIRKKRSGNFEFTNEKSATHVFFSTSEFKAWFENLKFGKLIKAAYSRSQTYFNPDEFENVLKYAEKNRKNYGDYYFILKKVQPK